MIIKTDIKKLRDPFILVDGGVYYMYGTRVTDDGWDNTVWTCYKNTSGKLDGDWQMVEKPLAVLPKNAVKNFWAPEVHKYKGKFYLFATYYSTLTNRRGCSIFKSDSPEGPFYEITDGTATPPDWDCIDATLYVDENGTPFMVFVHEWVSAPEQMGTMAVAQLSDDLTHFVSEPKELFRADAPKWSNHYVTDGCFLYKCEDNSLLMLWSNFSNSIDYCIGIAKSKNGKIDGEWIQEEKLLYSKEMNNNLDGGHGMIFTGLDNKKYLSLHSPNEAFGPIPETPIFIPVKEQNGTLVADI
ncbi:MAG: family 43 glycosylhydrolase [Clostridia bacterium]|nr:family 43 glycosylhydrolase [Clostridia bacterium]